MTTLTLTVAEYCALLKQPQLSVSANSLATASKYRARKTFVDGIQFDSQREANRWCELKIMERVGEIHCLRRQVTYSLHVNGYRICNYRADFVYRRRHDGALVVEDAKGLTRGTAYNLFRIKQKLMRAVHNIEVVEV